MSPHAVIVGAGPVGALSALLLARRDVSVTLLDRNDTLTTQSHAATFHPSTLDLLSALGIDLHTATEAVTVDAVQWRDNRGDVVAELDYRLLEGLTKHPFRVHLDQQVLLDRLAELIAGEAGIAFHTGVTAVDLDLDGPSVEAVSGTGERRIFAGDAVIGCDGAHSDVRALAGIAFPVAEYPTTALRAHVRADLAELLPAAARRPLSGLCYFRGGSDGVSALRMSNDTRLIVRTTNRRDGASRVAEAVANATPWDIDDLRVEGIDSYRLQRGVAGSYLAGTGPVLVMGDAAHVSSTAGGLNMNSGIHDAFALTAVLADWLYRRTDRSAVEAVATARRNYLLQQVIPRTEHRVRGLQDSENGSLTTHLAEIASLADNPSAARQFLLEASLLDTPLEAR